MAGVNWTHSEDTKFNENFCSVGMVILQCPISMTGVDRAQIEDRKGNENFKYSVCEWHSAVTCALLPERMVRKQTTENTLRIFLVVCVMGLK